jgi:hypothetical protein
MAETVEKLADQLVFSVADKSFGGMLPTDARTITAAILLCCFPADLSGEQFEEICRALHAATNRYLKMQFTQQFLM